MLVLAVGSQALRWWCIRTLGPQWNTRVIVVPGLPLVDAGPYRWFAHPNYVAVVVEGFALPLAGSAWVTAAVLHGAERRAADRPAALRDRALGSVESVIDVLVVGGGPIGLATALLRGPGGAHGGRRRAAHRTDRQGVRRRADAACRGRSARARGGAGGAAAARHQVPRREPQRGCGVPQRPGARRAAHGAARGVGRARRGCRGRGRAGARHGVLAVRRLRGGLGHRGALPRGRRRSALPHPARLRTGSGAGAARALRPAPALSRPRRGPTSSRSTGRRAPRLIVTPVDGTALVGVAILGAGGRRLRRAARPAFPDAAADRLGGARGRDRPCAAPGRCGRPCAAASRRAAGSCWSATPRATWTR